MLPTTIFLLANVLYLTLRVSPVSGSFPRPLSPQEEEIAIARAVAGDREAKDILIRHNLRLVAHIVKKYYASRADQDDLISIGTIGLIKAVNSYQPDKKIKLATYSARCIENEILMYFRSLRRQATEVSLSDPIDSDKEGNPLSLLDILSCEDHVLEDLEQGDQQRLLRQFMTESLTPRERRVLELRYGLSGAGPMPQREVADACGISRSYISRIEKKALSKLARRFEEEDAD
ncbi:MAG: RNA polymerase sporulation sigma factor SigK [Clostridia bacterium]|nr:RNA polymerase sporulation sigma factor SigK [Clostridia bacterium]